MRAAAAIASGIPRLGQSLRLQRHALQLARGAQRASIFTLSAAVGRGRTSPLWDHLGTGRRFVQVEAGEVRKGDLVEYKGRRSEVLSTKGQITNRKAFVHIEMRDIPGSTKRSNSFRVEEKIERLWVIKKKMAFLYDDGSSCVFQDEETFEELQVPCEFVGAALAFMEDGCECLVGSSEDGEVFFVHPPPKAKCLVESTDGKRAVLSNGKAIPVPSFIQAGDEILVNVAEQTFDSKVR